MKVDNNVINDIRNNINIVDVISSYIPLVSKGKNYFGVCPFHDDHSPSMSVSSEKQIYTCFSCGATGNVFKFIEDYEKISFKEALKKCSIMAGIDIDVGATDIKTIKNFDLYELYTISQRFYQNNINSEYGIKAKEYLHNRGITDDAIKHFNIGLSLNESNALTKILKGKKYQDKLLINSGLITENNIDVFRNRIMFPLADSNGKIIGYNGRIYNNEDTNRYVNTKETEIFKKREFLYNYDLAMEEARKLKQIIIMEGPMDVIRSYTIGIKNVIATLGTAFSDQHALAIRRLKCDVVLCFDGDEAGLKGTKLAIKALTKIGITPKIVMLKDSLDPDQYIRQYGDEFKETLNNTINIMEFKEKLLQSNLNLNNSVELASYVNQMLEDISKLDDPILKEITLNKLVTTSALTKETLINKLNTLETDSSETIEILEQPQNKKLNKYEKSERNLLYYMLHYPDVISMYDKKVTHISTDKYRHLAFQISSFYKQYKYINVADLLTELRDDPESIKTIGELESLNLKEKYSNEEIDDYLNNIHEANLNNQIGIYKKELARTDSLDKKIEYANKLIEFKMRSEENDR